MSGGPRQIGRYTLEQHIATGGMAEIHRARAPGSPTPVVIKTIRSDHAHDPEFRRLFALEAKIASSLRHEGIARVHEVGDAGGIPYLVLEHLQGLDLMRLFRTVHRGGDGFPPTVAAFIGHAVAEALAYAHGRTPPVIHRDVTPHNVMVTLEGAVKLLDFGIAHHERAGHDPEPSIRGKVAYMSPEQASGEAVDASTDVYALGAVMFELLSGRLLFRHRDRRTALAMVRKQPIPPLRLVAPAVPLALAEVVDRALERQPQARYADASVLRDALLDVRTHALPPMDASRLAGFVRLYVDAEFEGAPSKLDADSTSLPSDVAPALLVERPAEIWNDLSPALRCVADAAAVLGRQVSTSSVGHVAEQSDDALRPQLARLCEVGLLRPCVDTDDGWAFVDAGVPDQMRAALEPAVAQTLHLRAAQVGPQRGYAQAYYHLSQALGTLPLEDPRRFDALAQRESILRRWQHRRSQGQDLRAMQRCAQDDERRTQSDLQRLRFYLEIGRWRAAQALCSHLEMRPVSPRWVAAQAELAGSLALAQGELQLAEQRWVSGLARCSTLPDGARWQIRLLRALARVHEQRRAYGMAEACLGDALVRARAHKLRRLEANLLERTATLALLQHRYADAATLLREALLIDRALEDRYASGLKLSQLGWAYARLGLGARARQTLRRALELQTTMGIPSEIHRLKFRLGTTLLEDGPCDEGVKLLEEVSHWAERHGETLLALRAALTRHLALENDAAGFEPLLRRARLAGDAELVCLTLHALAGAEMQREDLPKALLYATEAVTLVRAGVATWESPAILGRLGDLRMALGDPELGRKLWAECRELLLRRLASFPDEAVAAAYRHQPEVRRRLGLGEPSAAIKPE